MIDSNRHIKAMDKINALLNVRERNCKEVLDRLVKSGFTAEESKEAVESALACGLLDEERYTRSFIRGKTHLGWGKGKIVSRLKQDGISDSVLERCEDEFPDMEEQMERALEQLRKRPSRSKNAYASYMRRLVGKGYSYDIAKQAVDLLLKEDL